MQIENVELNRGKSDDSQSENRTLSEVCLELLNDKSKLVKGNGLAEMTLEALPNSQLNQSESKDAKTTDMDHHAPELKHKLPPLPPPWKPDPICGPFDPFCKPDSDPFPWEPKPQPRPKPAPDRPRK